MIEKRNAEERGHMNFGWLDTHHTFSFGSYFDPKHMGFSSLRVINDDSILGGTGFDTHPHRDMEIITFVKEGALEHRDTLGNHSVIKPGEIQLMSAGTGIRHSEYNSLKNEKTAFYQIWIMPDKEGVKPSYQQYDFTKRQKQNDLTLLVSPEGGEGIASIHAQAKVYLGSWDQGENISLSLDPERSYWIQVIEGDLEFESSAAKTGDGLGFTESEKISAIAKENTRFLFFDLQ